MTDRRTTDRAYPTGAVTGLIGGTLMTPVTAAALQARLSPPAEDGSPVLDARQLDLLAAVTTRLIPQRDRPSPINLVRAFHVRLMHGAGDGWRYADMPADEAAHRRGLDALDASAAMAFGADFLRLEPARQDELLGQVQLGQVADAPWHGVSPARWFEEVLAMLVDIYYAHPLAQEEIGYAGMADARGWPAVGIASRAPHEPEPLSVAAASERS